MLERSNSKGAIFFQKVESFKKMPVFFSKFHLFLYGIQPFGCRSYQKSASWKFSFFRPHAIRPIPHLNMGQFIMPSSGASICMCVRVCVIKSGLVVCYSKSYCFSFGICLAKRGKLFITVSVVVYLL